MKEELEYIHDTKNSKIWIIEKISKKIYIKFGKKGSTLQEKELVFKTDNEATNEYNKKIKEKITKGYIKSGNIKSDKINSNNNKSKINIETVNLFIIFLIKIGKKVGEEMYKLQKNMYAKNSDISEDEIYKIYDTKISKFFNSKLTAINKQIENIQNMNILPFIKSGIIVKKINIKLKEDLLTDINNFSNKNKPDYHPGSNDKVLDIVHPSLYPLITKVETKIFTFRST